MCPAEGVRQARVRMAWLNSASGIPSTAARLDSGGFGGGGVLVLDVLTGAAIAGFVATGAGGWLCGRHAFAAIAARNS